MKKITISVALLSLLSQFFIPINTYALSSDFINNTEIVSNKDSYELEIPENIADTEVILESETKNIYKLENMVELTNSEGDTYVADGIVENEITSEDIDGVSGVTTYQVELSNLEKVGEENSFTNALSSLFITKVYADSDNVSTNSTWDKSISVKLNMTVNWKKYDSGHINITKVSGSYSRADSTVTITGSSVFIIQGMSGEDQTRTFNPGTRNSWSYATGFSKVGNTGWPTRKYAEYTVYLKRGSSTWQVELSNYLG
ncbi:hypothetical protein ACTGZQ_11040 [Streptococcus suis]